MLVVGSGQRVSIPRQLPAFSRVEIVSSGALEIEAGKPQSVTLEIDDNLMDLISTEVANDTLTIGATGRYQSQEDLRVRITVGELRYLGIPGAANAVLKGLRGEELSIDIGGAGTVRGSGRVERERLTVDGAGDNIDLYDVAAKDVRVEISGVGNAKVTATESLHVSLLGMGSVTYRGNPTVVERDILGMGTVSAAEG